MAKIIILIYQYDRFFNVERFSGGSNKITYRAISLSSHERTYEQYQKNEYLKFNVCEDR